MAREAVFAFMNITENTLIIIVDEFGKTPISSDLLKEAFGGDFTIFRQGEVICGLP